MEPSLPQPESKTIVLLNPSGGMDALRLNSPPTPCRPGSVEAFRPNDCSVPLILSCESVWSHVFTSFRVVLRKFSACLSPKCPLSD